MNVKSLFKSWFGLGLLIFILQYPSQYIFVLLGMDRMQALATAIAGLAASGIFTYYWHPHIMKPLFKIYAILTMVSFSLIMLSVMVFMNDSLRTILIMALQDLFNTSNIRTLIMTSIFTPLGLLIHGALWYLFITLGNNQMVNALKKSKIHD